MLQSLDIPRIQPLVLSFFIVMDGIAPSQVQGATLPGPGFLSSSGVQ